VESVVWIQERKNVLSGCFYLGAVLAFLRFAQIGSDAPPASGTEMPQRIGRRGWYLIALLLGACAFFSKTSTCTLPAALALILWWQRDRLRAGDALALLPFFALAIGSGLITVWVEKKFVGAAGEEWNLSA